MSSGIASSTDSKVRDFVRVSPSMTDTTLGLQTMMGSVTWHGFTAGWAGVHRAVQAMVTKIRAYVTEGVGGEEQECWTKTHKDEKVIHWPLAIWIQIMSSSSMVEGAGEVGREEIQRAKGTGEGELVVCGTVPVCPW